MSAPTSATPPTRPDIGDAPGGPPSPEPTAGRRLAIIALAVVVALLAYAGLTRIGLGNDAAGTSPDASTLELSLGDGGAMASCMVFDVAILSDMSPAFAGTATAIDGEMITLTVDRWYAGSEADTVVLHAPSGQVGLIGGIDFAVGQQYLITAADGNVNYCGYSGPATPELTDAFTQAFGA